nr:hypothetical protein [uncultured Campylobacter sp.]
MDILTGARRSEASGAKRGKVWRTNEMRGSRKELQNLATSKRCVPYLA